MFLERRESAITTYMAENVAQSEDARRRQLADGAMAILRQAGIELPAMTDNPIVAWAMSVMASTAPPQDAVVDEVIIALPVSCLSRFRTVTFA